MIIVTDLLRPPFDEGAKKATNCIIQTLKSDAMSDVIRITRARELIEASAEIHVNSMLLNLPLFKRLSLIPHSSVLYIPESSATILALVRSRLLEVLSRKSVYLLAFQPRSYNWLGRLFIKLAGPRAIITPSTSYERYLNSLGISAYRMPLGVDEKTYTEFDKERKSGLRRKYNIMQEQLVLLHVGHIQSSRNLGWLIGVAQHRRDIQVIIVSSTNQEPNLDLKRRLVKAGIRIVNRYIDDMAEIYNIANYYIFPVLSDQGAIATPLSVLEAMCCNIPIITTRFGSLVDMFTQDEHFGYVDSESEVLETLRKLDDAELSRCTNREKVSPYTWASISHAIERIVT